MIMKEQNNTTKKHLNQNKMKQTAVEWLVEQMNNIKSSSTNMNGKVQFLEKELYNLFDQAKQMEKEQIIGAWMDSAEHPFDCYAFAEQYYKETFKLE